MEQAALALVFLAVSACSALANPWLKLEGQGEMVSTARLMQAEDGFAGNGMTGTFEVRTEYGLTRWLTAVVDQETRLGSASGTAFERARAGARISMVRWDTGVLSIEGVAGVASARTQLAQGGTVTTLHAAGELRALLGQDFTSFGSHAWIAVESGWRWRGGPPADEAILDVTLGLQPRDDLFFMLQSFGVASVGGAHGSYDRYVSNKLQLSLVYEFAPGMWLQAGGIGSVYGDDAGDAGGLLAFWWRF
jgi:hypothetical protein